MMRDLSGIIAIAVSLLLAPAAFAAPVKTCRRAWNIAGLLRCYQDRPSTTSTFFRSNSARSDETAYTSFATPAFGIQGIANGK
jgi:hypothetical protein